MNQYLIELYTPNSAWKALSLDERTQYLNNVGAAMGKLSDLGVKALTLTQIDSNIDQTSEHQFLGIWHFPNEEIRDSTMLMLLARKLAFLNILRHCPIFNFRKKLMI